MRWCESKLESGTKQEEAAQAHPAGRGSSRSPPPPLWTGIQHVGCMAEKESLASERVRW